jgi:hypothetical protein
VTMKRVPDQRRDSGEVVGGQGWDHTPCGARTLGKQQWGGTANRLSVRNGVDDAGLADVHSEPVVAAPVVVVAVVVVAGGIVGSVVASSKPHSLVVAVVGGGASFEVRCLRVGGDDGQ